MRASPANASTAATWPAVKFPAVEEEEAEKLSDEKIPTSYVGSAGWLLSADGTDSSSDSGSDSDSGTYVWWMDFLGRNTIGILSPW